LVGRSTPWGYSRLIPHVLHIVDIPATYKLCFSCSSFPNSFNPGNPELQKWLKDTRIANDLWISGKIDSFDNPGFIPASGFPGGGRDGFDHF